MTYVDAVRTKKVPNPGTASFDTIEAAKQDPLILPKLQFFMAISRTFTPFLTKYQTDAPVMPFLCKDLVELFQVIKLIMKNQEEKEKQVERVWGILYVCGHACSRQKWETLFGSLIHETRP